MNQHVLFCSTKVQDIYNLYQILSEEFLKTHKCQAEFRITTRSSMKEFCLSVEDATETQRNWLKDATLQLLEKKFSKIVDKA